jgi:hypothetical protein
MCCDTYGRLCSYVLSRKIIILRTSEYGVVLSIIMTWSHARRRHVPVVRDGHGQSCQLRVRDKYNKNSVGVSLLSLRSPRCAHGSAVRCRVGCRRMVSAGPRRRAPYRSTRAVRRGQTNTHTRSRTYSPAPTPVGYRTVRSYVPHRTVCVYMCMYTE